jgi:hypothetical protein
MKCVFTSVLTLVVLQPLGGAASFINVGLIDPNAQDISRVLECRDDFGGRLDLPLQPPSDATASEADFQYWLPPESE